MAKFDEPFETTQELYDEKIREIGLDTYINITVVIDNKRKKVYDVLKASPILKYRTGDDVIIFLNETIFDKLTPEQRNIIVEESLAGIHYDIDKDKLIMTPKDVLAYSGILSKFTYETWNVLMESVKSLYRAEKNDD